MNIFSQEDNSDISESLPSPLMPLTGDIDLSGLIQFGLTKAASNQFTAIIAKDSELVPGRVTRVDGISTFVQTATVDYRAVSKFARIAHKDEFEIEPAQPTVGDWVLVRIGENQDPDEIELVLPRISLLSRKRVIRGKEQGDVQVLASNINTVFVVQSATYFNPNRLQREIALVWGSGATPVVVITKIDLLEEGQDPTRVIAQAKQSAPGVEVFVVSGITGAGIDPLRKFTESGITVVFIGASGVGKSTLVNILVGQQVMETADVRQSDAHGRHTTVTRQLLRLPNGGVLIDTPGIRTIGLVSGSEDALAKTFSDVEAYMWKCRFSDCGHSSEPGCAIVEALAKDNLSQSRFDSYMRIRRELQFEETKKDATGKIAHQRKLKVVAKANRQRTKGEKHKKS